MGASGEPPALFQRGLPNPSPPSALFPSEKRGEGQKQGHAKQVDVHRARGPDWWFRKLIFRVHGALTSPALAISNSHNDLVWGTSRGPSRLGLELRRCAVASVGRRRKPAVRGLCKLTEYSAPHLGARVGYASRAAEMNRQDPGWPRPPACFIEQSIHTPSSQPLTWPCSGCVFT